MQGFVSPRCMSFSVARHLDELRPQTGGRTTYIYSGSPANSGGAKKYLGANGFKSKNKERDVADASELISESLDFGIEALGRCVCRAILKVIGNGSVAVLHGLNDRVEKLTVQPLYLVVPPSEFCQ